MRKPDVNQKYYRALARRCIYDNTAKSKRIDSIITMLIIVVSAAAINHMIFKFLIWS